MNNCPRAGGGMMGSGMMGGGMMGGGMMGGGNMMMDHMMGGADGGSMMQSSSMMGGGRMMEACPMMDGGATMMGGSMMGGILSPDSKGAWTKALNEEYRAEALYGSLVTKFGTSPTFRDIARSDRHQAWILESVGLAHGLELPSRPAAAQDRGDLKTAAAGCRAGVESEKKVIALYDDLLKKDLPADLRRTFEHLRAASAERHLRDFEVCH
jgi:hypothetical protein